MDSVIYYKGTLHEEEEDGRRYSVKEWYFGQKRKDVFFIKKVQNKRSGFNVIQKHLKWCFCQYFVILGFFCKLPYTCPWSAALFWISTAYINCRFSWSAATIWCLKLENGWGNSSRITGPQVALHIRSMVVEFVQVIHIGSAKMLEKMPQIVILNQSVIKSKVAKMMVRCPQILAQQIQQTKNTFYFHKS